MTGTEEQDLELIPRIVRDKLDRVGIKLHLKEWQALALAERRRLRDLPCTTPAEVDAYATAVAHLIQQTTGAPPERL